MKQIQMDIFGQYFGLTEYTEQSMVCCSLHRQSTIWYLNFDAMNGNNIFIEMCNVCESSCKQLN